MKSGSSSKNFNFKETKLKIFSTTNVTKEQSQRLDIKSVSIFDYLTDLVTCVELRRNKYLNNKKCS